MSVFESFCVLHWQQSVLVMRFLVFCTGCLRQFLRRVLVSCTAVISLGVQEGIGVSQCDVVDEEGRELSTCRKTPLYAILPLDLWGLRGLWSILAGCVRVMG